MIATIGIEHMPFSDRVVIRHLTEKAGNRREVRIVYEELAHELQCHRNTAYNAVKRLRAAGHIEIVSGSTRTGYVYRIVCDDHTI